MPAAHPSLDGLRAAGHRITPVRQEIVALLARSRMPLTAAEIGVRLSRVRPGTNKTTVYRELEFLVAQEVVSVVRFGERSARYEIAGGEHHHHLVCTRCGRVVDIMLSDDPDRHAARIRRETGFTVTSHALEFFGSCRDCS